MGIWKILILPWKQVDLIFSLVLFLLYFLSLWLSLGSERKITYRILDNRCSKSIMVLRAKSLVMHQSKIHSTNAKYYSPCNLWPLLKLLSSCGINDISCVHLKIGFELFSRSTLQLECNLLMFITYNALFDLKGLRELRLWNSLWYMYCVDCTC